MEQMDAFFSDLQTTLGPLWPVLVFILILIVGYIVAKIFERLVRSGLRRTTLDDRLAEHMSSDQTSVSSEKVGGKIVFWILMVLVFIVAFETVNLGAVSGSLGVFMDRILGFIPNLIGAALLALVAFIVATVLRMLTRKALEAANVDQRIHEADESDADVQSSTTSAPRGTTTSETVPEGTAPRASASRPPAAGEPMSSDTPAKRVSVSKSLSDAVFYFVLLIFLPAILDALQLSGILVPVQELVNEILAFLPNLLLATIILVAGWFVAKVIRNIVTNLAAAAGADRLSERIGLSQATGRTRLSYLIGLVVYILVLVPVIVAALNALQVEAVTGPASAMLAQFLEAIPRIFVAALILIIAYVVGRLLASLVTNLLSGAGFNRIFQGLGFRSTQAEADATTVPHRAADRTRMDTRTPAGIVGIIILVGVMLFAATEAANSLGLEALALLIGDFTILAGRILLGLVIFAIGLYLANLAYSAVKQSDTSQATVLAIGARVSIIVLAAAMGLRQMGLADSIINLAFGLTLGAIAVAAALAFGLGGRDVAREQLERFQKKAEKGGLNPPESLKPDRTSPGASRETRPGAQD